MNGKNIRRKTMGKFVMVKTMNMEVTNWPKEMVRQIQESVSRYNVKLSPVTTVTLGQFFISKRTS